MAKPLDTKKIAALANSIESLKAQIAKEEAELARLCGVAVPAAEGDAPKRGRPRRSRTNVEVVMRTLTPEEIAERDKTALTVADAETAAQPMPNHDPDRADPNEAAGDIPEFLRRGGTMTDAEKLAAAERVMGEEAKS